MKTHKTRVSNSPGKLRLLETCQHEFREKLNIRHACYIIIAELSYETQYKTWLRPPLRILGCNDEFHHCNLILLMRIAR